MIDFSNLFSIENLTRILIYGVVLMTAFPFHEFAHAFVANKLGDMTGRYQGRLSLNPLRHIDPFGTVCMLLTGFGWGKPVPVNTYNFKNKRLGFALVAAAGPVSNIILAFFFLLLFKILAFFGLVEAGWMYLVFNLLIFVNLRLAVFNLIPVPPLDGSRIAAYFIKSDIWGIIEQYQTFVFIGLILIMNTGVLQVPLEFLSNLLYNLIDLLSGLNWYLL